jgi:hypothetical protein
MLFVLGLLPNHHAPTSHRTPATNTKVIDARTSQIRNSGWLSNGQQAALFAIRRAVLKQEELIVSRPLMLFLRLGFEVNPMLLFS